MTDTVKQVQQWTTRGDGLDNLSRSSAPMPTPGKNEVLVEIKAVSLNYRDTEVAMGLYNHHKSISKEEKPSVPCSDMCGVIVAVGPQDDDDSSWPKWQKGDRVISTFIQSHLSGQITAADMAQGLGKPLEGVLQTYRVFPAQGLVKCPDYLTDEEASCLPIAALTAWMSLFPNGDAPNGEGGKKKKNTVLLQGTGGVSIAALQIAKAAGYKVIITSSSDDKLKRAKELGADCGINYRTEKEWQDKVMELTDNQGADIILEVGGAETLYKSLDCVAFGGTIACIGYVSGKEDAETQTRMNMNLLVLRKNVTLKGILVGPRDVFEGQMLPFYEKNGIRPVVDRVFGFEEGKDAFQWMFGSGKLFGKVVVRVS